MNKTMLKRLHEGDVVQGIFSGLELMDFVVSSITDDHVMVVRELGIVLPCEWFLDNTATRLERISSLRVGDRVRNVYSGNVYVITEVRGDSYAIGRQTREITDPSDWFIVRKGQAVLV